MRRAVVFILMSFLLLCMWTGLRADPLKDLVEKAETGDGESLFRLATLYDIGYDSIPVDSAYSTELYEKAALAGYVPAMNYLGYRLVSGEYSGAGKDVSRGLNWLEKAAAGGDAKAASNLGWLLTDGTHVEKDYGKALYWFEKAASSGLPVAMSMLADLYRDGRGTPVDSVRADSLYRRAFELGLADAGYKLSDLEKDRFDTLSAPQLVEAGKYFYKRSAPSAGVRLFYKAADMGDATALALLGDAYTRAVGVPYDHELSMLYFAKAAVSGNAPAQFIVGELLEIFPDSFASIEGFDPEVYGISPGQFSDPFFWYEKAAASGIEDAEAANKMLFE